jgi:hypothetical protein
VHFPFFDAVSNKPENEINQRIYCVVMLLASEPK